LCWSRLGARLRVNVDLGERFSPLLLGERDLAAVVIGDDDLVGAVVDFHGRTATLNTTQLNTRDVRSEVAHLSHFFLPPFFSSLEVFTFEN